MKEILSSGLPHFGVDPQRAEPLAEYGRLLLEQNQVMNLTAITDPADVARLHFLDCAGVFSAAQLDGITLLDVGTGAGFPGMALKVMQPSIHLTLLDGLNKRIEWLKQIAPLLGAEGVTFLHGRAEDFSRKAEYREQFDVVTSRAVADLRLLCELCLPYVKVGGVFLAMKSTNCQDELAAAEHGISLLGGEVKQPVDYTIPGTDVTHRVVVIQKVCPTPAIYPRRFAKMQKSPL